MTAPSALIGHTGFVGSSLLRQTVFDYGYNSRNFREIRGARLGLVVCAGVSAAKWIANREPDEDRRRIVELTSVLETARVEEFVLVSTIDVYRDPSAGGDESTPLSPPDNAYGRHRLELEQWARATFPACRIVRLPALFGPGLRKNALYDLIHDNQVGAINPASVYQWYPIDRLWADIGVARRAGLHSVNLFTEPLPMTRILDACFPGAAVGPARMPAPRYDMRSVHAAVFGGRGGYVMSADACLASIAAFVAAEKAGR